MTDDTKNKPTLFRVIDGDGQVPVVTEPTTPLYEYLIIDTDHNEHYAEGFLVFTTQHVAVMREEAQGALPVLLMPLSSVFKVVLLEDDGELIDEEVF